MPSVDRAPALLEQSSVDDGVRAGMGWIEDEELAATTFDLAASELIIDLDRAVVTHAPRGCHRRHLRVRHAQSRRQSQCRPCTPLECHTMPAASSVVHRWRPHSGASPRSASLLLAAGSVIVTEPVESGSGNAPQPPRERMVSSAGRHRGSNGLYSRPSGGVFVQQVWTKVCHGIVPLIAPS
jgi:hypothetical protein